ncbi:MAG: hypothetical protein EOM58_12830 [Clostridia bacterium]|nr:hypothetical protein [Clostridia bacterium]
MAKQSKNQEPVDFHKDISTEGIKRSFLHNRLYPLAKDEYSATEHDHYLALAVTVRDRIVERGQYHHGHGHIHQQPDNPLPVVIADDPCTADDHPAEHIDKQQELCGDHPVYNVIHS